MSQESILQQFDQLGTWSRGDQRAPHKPLLVLYALGKWNLGERSDIPFSQVNRDLGQLLKEFGPPRRSHHPEYPFWRLQADGVWTVHAPKDIATRQSNTDPPKSVLLALDVHAGFSDYVKNALNADPTLVAQIAGRLLQRHFPESIHADVLSAVGLPIGADLLLDRKRDPTFRIRILTAYEYRCAVCGFDVRLGSISIALDAAHIRWHQAGGPDTEGNGIALCVLHHKLFDLGIFTLDEEYVVLASDQANGTKGFQEALMGHHGNRIRAAQRTEWRPEPAFLAWHKREVFKGVARERPRSLLT